MSADKNGDEGSPSNTVNFHMIKSHLFRVAHADGAFGGVAPAGNIHVTFYSERNALPQRLVHTVSDAGELGDEISRYGKDGIVRELEIDIVLSLEAATGFRKWLDGRITELEALRALAKTLEAKKGEGDT